MNALEKTFTSREIAVLRQLLEGGALGQIANALDISDAMVWIHLRTIFRELKVENRSQAVTWARQNGISDEAPRV
jgi:LuxR family transcriptional regulator, csgAB operon transcriptional regulatory protein